MPDYVLTPLVKHKRSLPLETAFVLSEMPIHWLPVQRCIANDTLERNRVAPPLVLTRKNPIHLLRTREGGGSPSQGGLAHGENN